MRARNVESVLFAAIASMTLFASSAGATSAADMSATKAAEAVAAGIAPVTDTRDLRVAVPYRDAGQRANDLRATDIRASDIRFASLSPAPTAQAAVAQPQQVPRNSTKDLLLLTLVGGMLVAYQLLRKHRLLRQQPFSL